MSNFVLKDSKETQGMLSGDIVYNVDVPQKNVTYSTIEAFQFSNQQLRFQNLAVNSVLSSSMELETDITVTINGKT